MLVETTTYTIKCDVCSEDVSEDGIVGYDDKGFVRQMANEAGWEQINGKDYCQDCFIIDDKTLMPRERTHIKGQTIEVGDKKFHYSMDDILGKGEKTVGKVRICYLE